MLLRDDPTPAEVREKMREIFERSEFRRSKSWIERVLDWIGRHLSPGEVSGGSGWGGSIGPVVGWVAIVLLAIGLAVLIWYVIRNFTPRAKKVKKRQLTDVEIEELRTASEWASDADRLEASGDWKEAIRCRYRELVARLVDAGVAAPHAGRTTGELRIDVAERAPEVGTEFSRATGLFELPWYADVPTGRDENAEFKALAARVLEEVS